MFKTYRVYQYRPDNQPRDLDTFLASCMFSAKIDTLNDPFEFAAMTALHEHPDKQDELKNAGITCFCRSISNPLLWSHYAASHKGFAIGYDATHPFFGGDKGIMQRLLHDVRYEDAPPSPDRFSVDELVMAATLTKPTCWAYEQELRMIREVGGQLFEVPKDAVQELVLGAAMSDDRVNEIVCKVQSASIKVEFTKMVYADEGYGVLPRPL
jgi:hypothetical protein